jgi:hypothetical protein
MSKRANGAYPKCRIRRSNCVDHEPQVLIVDREKENNLPALFQTHARPGQMLCFPQQPVGAEVDLMGRLSNPPDALECMADQGGCGNPPPRLTTSKGAKGSAHPPEMGDLEEKGQLSNPVQRRLSRGVVGELAHLYEEGASIDALGRRYGVHRTTIIAQLDRRGVPRRR